MMHGQKNIKLTGDGGVFQGSQKLTIFNHY
jgi:hypothetical protein